MTIAEYNKSVDDFADGLYRFILKNLKDEDKAKDVVQDTYEKLWIKVSDISYKKVKSYLFTAGYHTMIDLIRKEKRQDNYENFNVDMNFHNEQYTDVSEILNEAINKLPDDQRSVILLRDYEGYSYKEIAEITDLSVDQVKVYIYRGRMFLKSYIGSIETVI